MKKTFLILLLFISHEIIACSCGVIPFMTKVSLSDFVATARIIDISPDPKNNQRHNITIEVIDLFKGEPVSSLKIYSSLNSSCSFFTPKNTTWLIFAGKNKEGDLSFGFCSGVKQLDKQFNSTRYPYAKKNYKKSLLFNLEVLNYLKENKINFNNDLDIRTHLPLNSLELFKGIEAPKERFAIYEVTINTNFSVAEIKTIKGFRNKSLDNQLPEILKENLTVRNRRKNNKITKKTTVLFGLYYYEAEKR